MENDLHAILSNPARLRQRQEKWDTLLEGIKTLEGDKDISIEAISRKWLHTPSKKICKRKTKSIMPYRRCKDYKVFDKSLLNSMVSHYELKAQKPICSPTRKHVPPLKSSRKCEAVNIKNNTTSNILQKIEKRNSIHISSKNKSCNTVLVDDILEAEKTNDTYSSGFVSGSNSMSSSIVSIPVTCKNKTRSLIDVIFADASRRTVTKTKLGFNWLNELSFTDKLHQQDQDYIQSFISHYGTSKIDLTTMTKLVYVFKEDYVDMTKAILGMRVLESLNESDTAKFTILHNVVKENILYLLRSFEVDIIEIYVEYILWQYVARRKY